VVDSATDTTIELADGGNDLVRTTVTHTMQDNVENLLMLNVASPASNDFNAVGNILANKITGNNGNNSIDGGDGDDNLIGGKGNDTLTGGAGVDVMNGGSGNDTYVIDSITETMIETSSGGVDTVSINLTFTLTANFENLTLTGSDDIDGTGTVSDNIMTGNSGNNVLVGFNGADTFLGGAGLDTIDGGEDDDLITGGANGDDLTGGTGADQFIYTTAASGNDTIQDFNNLNGDGVQGDLLVFDGLLEGTFAYLGSAGFSSSGNTEARVSSGDVLIDFDGDGSADLTITMTGLGSAAELTADDFLFI